MDKEKLKFLPIHVHYTYIYTLIRVAYVMNNDKKEHQNILLSQDICPLPPASVYIGDYVTATYTKSRKTTKEVRRD